MICVALRVVVQSETVSVKLTLNPNSNKRLRCKIIELHAHADKMKTHLWATRKSYQSKLDVANAEIVRKDAMLRTLRLKIKINALEAECQALSREEEKHRLICACENLQLTIAAQARVIASLLPLIQTTRDLRSSHDQSMWNERLAEIRKDLESLSVSRCLVSEVLELVSKVTHRLRNVERCTVVARSDKLDDDTPEWLRNADMALRERVQSAGR